MKVAVKCGNGIPSFVKRPTPWFTYTNFKIPSQKNTPPAISLNSSVDLGPSVGGLKSQKKNLLMDCSFHLYNRNNHEIFPEHKSFLRLAGASAISSESSWAMISGNEKITVDYYPVHPATPATESRGSGTVENSPLF